MKFKKFLEKNEEPGIIFCFGRFNPPFTLGHEEMFKFMGKFAKKYNTDAIIFTSHIQNEKKNPLNFNDKVLYLGLGSPKNVNVSNIPFKNPFQILEDLIKDKKYKRIYFAIGNDRINDFQSLKKYAQQYSNDINTNIEFNIINTGNRKENVSGNQLRILAKNDNFKEFKDILAVSLYPYAEEIFEKTKQGLKK